MAQTHHLDRLTAVDASFLHNEGEASHMHVGGVTMFEGPPPAIGDFLDHIRSRLHLVPRYRQKLAVPPLETGRPLWVDDPTFNLEYHVRHTALPEPGSEDQLLRLSARIFSQRLDRSKPLWETWMVEGLEENRFALISKTHHALIDGISGVDLLTVLFDLTPVPQPVEADGEEWAPSPEPSGAELIAAGVKGMVKTSVKVAARVAGAATRPEAAVEKLREAIEGVGEIAWAGLNPAPETPLNLEIGSHRRIGVVRFELEEFKAVKDALGGTVNDVVLTVVAGGLRELLSSRSEQVEGRVVRALVPVSVRRAGEEGVYNNRVSAMFAELPVGIVDPAERLQRVREQMDGLKQSKQAVAGEVLTSLSGFAPPLLLALGGRLAARSPSLGVHTGITNVPGPQGPLQTLGRRMLESFPFVPVIGRVRTSIAIFSYNGGLYFGVTGDYDSSRDIGILTAGVEASMRELLGARAAAPTPAPGEAAPQGRETQV
jgi:diacylglycerol O-acyltransferase